MAYMLAIHENIDIDWYAFNLYTSVHPGTNGSMCINEQMTRPVICILFIYIVMRTFVLVDKTTKTMDDMGKIGRRTWTHAWNWVMFKASLGEMYYMLVLDGFGICTVCYFVCLNDNSNPYLNNFDIYIYCKFNVTWIWLCFEGKLRFVMVSEFFYDDDHSHFDAHPKTAPTSSPLAENDRPARLQKDKTIISWDYW
jgi:hypothetical protein